MVTETSFSFQPDSPERPDVLSLLGAHLAFAATQSPPEDVHALDPAGLMAPDVSFFSLREEGRLLGVGALRRLSSEHAELKSMHTAEAERGRGVGRHIAISLLGIARDRGYTRVSLETGTMDAFAAARGLYESLGFAECPPFGDYGHSEYSVCMSLDLTD